MVPPRTSIQYKFDVILANICENFGLVRNMQDDPENFNSFLDLDRQNNINTPLNFFI